MRFTIAAGLCVILAGCAQIGPAGSPAANTTSSPSADSAASGPQISPPPVSPTAPGNPLPAFACTDLTGGATGVANVTAVRVAEQAGFDRFVLQFDAAVPKYTVKRQDKPTFVVGASGQSITLNGTAGVLVTVHSATESNTYTGSTDISHPEFVVLKEARLTQDFEGYVSWGLGLDHPACMRAVVVPAQPGISARLIVDFSTATS